MRLAISPRRNRWLHLGTQVSTNQGVHLSAARLSTHMHIIGPPGSGKTRFLFSLFQQLARHPDGTLILFNVKGDLGTMARDWCIAHGYAGRLLWFDPAEEDNIIGYNPLQPNGLSVATQAKNVREAIRASWGQRSFDETAQLARFLYLTLFVVRELNFTLTEALGLLRPESPVRHAMLPAIRDPYIRDEFEYLDSLRGSRQDELLASTLARLESFVLDPGIRRIITQQAHALDLGQVMRDRHILILNFEQYKPLALDDVKLLGRFVINDIVTHVFQRPKDQRTPVYLLLDECQTVATADLCRALDQGRELGLHCVLANQYLEQLNLEEASGLLYHSVMKSARTKVLFGGMSTAELEVLTPEVMLDRYDPWRVKDELTALEIDPVESTREVITEGKSRSLDIGQSTGINRSTSSAYTEGQETTRGEAAGWSVERGSSTTRSLTKSASQATSQTLGHTNSAASAISSGRGRSTTSQDSVGETRSAGQTATLTLGSPLGSTSEQHSTGNSHSDFTSHSDTTSHSESDSQTESLTESEARSTAYGVHQTFGRNRSVSLTEGRSVSRTQGEQRGTTQTRSRGVNIGKNWSRSVVPWNEYRKRRNVSSRQFLNKEEQLTLALQQVQSQPTGHFFVKTANQPGIFARAQFVKRPWISTRSLTVGLERIYSQARYATCQQINAEEQERAHRLMELRYNKEEQPGSPETNHADQSQEKQTNIPKPKKKSATARKNAAPNPFATIKIEDE